MKPSIYSCFIPLNLRTSRDWTSDTESESTFEMSSFTVLDLNQGSSTDSDDNSILWSGECMTDTSTDSSSGQETFA